MSHLSMALLGPFQATLDGRPVEGLNSDRLRALLAYLAVESGRQHPREQLAALLWPQRTDRESLSALRNALSKLRGTLGDRNPAGDETGPSPFLRITRTTVQLSQAGDHWLDVAEFTSLSSQAGERDLERAAALYRGPFLHGLSVADSPAFDEWMLFRGDEYCRLLLGVLGQLASLRAAGGDHAEAARWARRQLELEPYREVAHRQLMVALALGGERSAALAHYETCRRLLAGELGCEPEDETQALYAQIRDGTLALPSSPPLRVSASPRPPVPASLFVAREQELARLGSLLDQALDGRGGVALVAGEAGSGKTTLLDEFSRRASQAHSGLIALRGSCNAQGGTGDPYLPFREILQTLAGDVEGKRTGGTLTAEQARRAWQALPAVGAALAEHGPDLIDTFVPGEPLLRRVQAFPGTARAAFGQQKLREIVSRLGKDPAAPAPQSGLFAQVTQVLHAVAGGWPLLLAIDDLQWADGGTTALLFHLGRRLTGSRILLVCAYRPEALQDPADPKGLGRPLGSVLRELARQWGDVLVDLGRADGRAFVEAYVDSEPNRLGAGFRQVLYEHTEGNPLFTVELLRSFERHGTLLQDEGGFWIEAGELDWDRLPPQVEAVIAGHLAALSAEDRALLGAASVQGESFVAEVTARVLGCGEKEVVERLSGALCARHRLVRAVSVDRLPASGQRLSRYHFRHALVQAAAYRSLDAVERVWLHETTAKALEAIYGPAGQAEGEQPAELAPALARHYEAAGMPMEAARALHDAGRHAMRVSAFREALDLFDHGLALLAHETLSPLRTELERLLKLARLVPQRNLDGLSGPKTEDALMRAKQAWAGEEQGGPMFQLLAAEAEDLSATGHYEAALALATRLQAEAGQRGEEDFSAIAHWRLGAIHSALGHLDEGERHFDWLLTWLTPEKWTALRFLAGHDFTAACLALSAINQWFLGYPETALARATEAMRGAVARGERYGQAFAFGMGAAALFLLRVGDAEMEPRIEYLRRLCLEESYEMWQWYADVFVGRLIALRGDRDCLAGVRRMQAAIARWRGEGLVPDTDILTTVLADTCLVAAGRLGPPTPLRSGDHRPTLPCSGDFRGDQAARAEALAAGLAAIESMLGPESVRCGPHWAAELHRVRGELLLERDGPAAAVDALACFETALELARELGVPSVEMRAAMSLVRLRERQPDSGVSELAEVRHSLRHVYARFTEGFAFPDLQDAAALIGR